MPHPLPKRAERPALQFFSVLPRADAGLAVAWWVVLLLRGVLPALFAIVMGALVAAVQRSESLAAPLAVTGIIFVTASEIGRAHV